MDNLTWVQTEDLVRHYKSNSNVYLRNLVLMAHHSFLHHLAKKRTSNFTLQEDIVQESVVKMIELLEDYKPTQGSIFINTISYRLIDCMSDYIDKSKSLTNVVHRKGTISERNESVRCSVDTDQYSFINHIIASDILDKISNYLAREDYTMRFTFYQKFINSNNIREIAAFMQTHRHYLAVKLKQFLADLKEALGLVSFSM